MAFSGKNTCDVRRRRYLGAQGGGGGCEGTRGKFSKERPERHQDSARKCALVLALKTTGSRQTLLRERVS